jgi:phenylacetate-CoA ligase
VNKGGNDILKLSIEIRRGGNPDALVKALIAQVKQTFELVPQILVLESGTLAREFEANVKAARFVDRRG